MKTIYYVQMVTAASTGDVYIPHNNTTLNEKFGDNESLETRVGDTAIQYFGVGLKPENYTDDPFNNEIYIHDAIDACVYVPLPVMMIPLDEDIDVSKSQDYRLRKVENIDGDDYACYYLKKLNNNAPANTFEVKDLLGKPDLVIYDPTKYNVLDPIYGGKEIVPEKNMAIAHSKKVPIELSVLETIAIKKYVKIKHGGRIKVGPDGDIYPNIGEVMLCHGVDGVTANGRRNAEGVQVSFFMDTEHPMDENRTLYQSFEIGGIETLAFNTSKVGV